MPDLDSAVAEAALARRESRLLDAHRILSEAIAKHTDPRVMAALGQIERDLGNHESALALYREAAAIWRARGDQARLAHAVRHVADILLDTGRLQEAEPHYAEALALYRTLPATPPTNIANTLRGYAILKQQIDQPADARSYWQEAREIYAAHGVAPGVREADRRLAEL